MLSLNNVVDLLIIVVRVCHLNLHFRCMFLCLLIGYFMAGLFVVHVLEYSVFNLLVSILKTLYVSLALLCKNLRILERLFVVTDR